MIISPNLTKNRQPDHFTSISVDKVKVLVFCRLHNLSHFGEGWSLLPLFPIYRGTDYMQLWPIRIINSDTHSWTDPDILSSQTYYKVSAVKETPCNPLKIESDMIFALRNFVSVKLVL